jgi:hypothetical protein
MSIGGTWQGELMPPRSKRRRKKPETEQLRNFYLGTATPGFLESLRDPASDASQLLEAAKMVAQQARKVDPQTLGEAASEKHDSPPARGGVAKAIALADTV